MSTPPIALPLFADNVRFREIGMLLKVTAEERAWLKQEAKKRGIRDVASLLRMCIRESLLSTPKGKK